MNYQELYVVCQIEDFSLKVMVNKFFNNEIQVLYKENIVNEQFADNGVILDPIATSKVLAKVINNINDIFKIKVQRISLSLPSNNLKIYQSQAMLDFKEMHHPVSVEDVNKLIEMTNNINISSDEVICLTKPYNFKVDNQGFEDVLPIGHKGQIATVDSLIYSLPINIYNSQLEVIKLVECEVLSITIDQFALIFNLNNAANNNLVLIDWAINNTKISVFSNSALYAIKNINIGFNQIIQALMTKMHCSYGKAEKYLTKIININSNYLGDLIIDKYYDANNKKLITFSKRELQDIVRTKINEIMEIASYFLNDIIKNDNQIKIIFTGQTINLPGFNAYIRDYHELKNVKFMMNIALGVDSCDWATLLGATHYQHNLNLFNNMLITSTNNLQNQNNNKEVLKNYEKNKYHNHLNLNYKYNGNR